MGSISLRAGTLRIWIWKTSRGLAEGEDTEEMVLIQESAHEERYLEYLRSDKETCRRACGASCTAGRAGRQGEAEENDDREFTESAIAA
jgi:hypothetical protein